MINWGFDAPFHTFSRLSISITSPTDSSYLARWCLASPFVNCERSPVFKFLCSQVEINHISMFRYVWVELKLILTYSWTSIFQKNTKARKNVTAIYARRLSLINVQSNVDFNGPTVCKNESTSPCKRHSANTHKVTSLTFPRYYEAQ